MAGSSGGCDAKLGTVQPTRRQLQRLEHIRSELAGLDWCLPGSLTIRLGPCGKPACACHRDERRHHGPFRSWTRKVAGKTVTRLLDDDQMDEYGSFFDNHRRLKELVRELEELSVDVVESDAHWGAARR